MKKTLRIAILVILGLFGFACGNALADNANSLDYNQGVTAGYALCDASSGVCVEVDSSGHLQVDVISGGATCSNITANNAVTSCIPGTAATNLGKAEDAAHASSDTGVAILGVRNDTCAALGGSDGDYAPLQVDATGYLYVVQAGEYAEDAAHTTADVGLQLLSVRNDVLAALGGTDGDYSPLQVNDIGALFVTGEHAEDVAHVTADYGNQVLAVRNDTLASLSGTDGDYSPLQVGANGALFVRIAGSAAADLGKAEDAAHASSDVGVLSIAVRNDVLATLGGADGDNSPFQVNDIGALFVTGEHVEDAAHVSADYGNQVLAVRNDALAALGGTDGDYSPLQVGATGGLFITGDSKEDAAIGDGDYGVPILVRRQDALAADSGTDDDYSRLSVNDIGALFVTGEHIEDAAHASGDYGNQILVVRNDALAALGGTDGDYTPLQVNDIGALFVTGEHAEDAAHVSADYGNQVLAVRNDGLSALSGADGDYSPLQVNADGALYVEVTPRAVTGVVNAADAQIKGSAGVVYAVIVTTDGVTSGDKIEIKNSTDNSGTSLCTIVCGATDDVYTFSPSVGITYGLGIYADITISGGTMTFTVLYE